MCVVKMVSDPYEDLGSVFNLVEYVLRDKVTGGTVRNCGGYNTSEERSYVFKRIVENLKRQGT